jgi:glycosyltransferase involved in cell wall biosynthesis
MPFNQRRVLILSEIIAPYRIPVFNALAQREELDLLVVFLSETDTGLRQWRVYKDEIRFQYEVLPSWRIRAGRHNLLLNRGLRSCLKKFSPEAIICGGYNYYASWEALSWARRHEADFILWSESNAQDSRKGQPWVESLKKRFIAGCDMFLVPGQVSQEYLQTLGAAPDDIVVAPNAVDNDWFQTQADSVRSNASVFREKLKLPDSYLLFVGRLVREKGTFDLLEAYGKLEESVRSKVGLVFAGDGRSKTELQREAQRISPGTIVFAGFTHREDLAALYALAEALILPTHTDPWGLVVNEAMACRLPIVVTHVAGCAADLVKDGWNGFVVPARDTGKLKDAIDSLVENSELRQTMGIRSSERIQNYSAEACARGLAEAVLREGAAIR